MIYNTHVEFIPQGLDIVLVLALFDKISISCVKWFVCLIMALLLPLKTKISISG
jgi:hypothetical protein